MKRLFSSAIIMLVLVGCSNDEEMLVTTRTQCYISSFYLLGSDNLSVLASRPVIDTTACTVNAVVLKGINLKKVKPYCSLATDACISPRMGTWTDFSLPKTYTVISGNRKIKKDYLITVTIQ